jgi:hypothetical protein
VTRRFLIFFFFFSPSVFFVLHRNTRVPYTHNNNNNNNIVHIGTFFRKDARGRQSLEENKRKRVSYIIIVNLYIFTYTYIHVNRECVFEVFIILRMYTLVVGWLTVSVSLICRGKGHSSGSNARLLLISRFVTYRLHIIIIIIYCTSEKIIILYARCWCVTRRSHVFAGGAKSHQSERRNRKSPGQRS